MNILIVENSVAFTGALKSALCEAYLLSNKHKISFLLPSHSTALPIIREKGFKVHALPLKEISKSPSALLAYPFTLVRNLLALKKIVRSEDIEVVQVNDFYNLLGALLKLSGYKGILLTWVRFLPSALPGALRTIWIKAAQKYSDRVIAVSDVVWKQLPQDKKTIRLYDPVCFSNSLRTETQTNQLVTFLYLSNFIRGKGQEYAIEAFARAYKKDNNIRLKLVGGDMGLHKNKVFRDELVNQVRQLGLEDVIVFNDFIADVETEIKSADVVLNFSNGEALSMICLEASFYERPVIATRCGGPEEIILHKETGLLVPRKDITAMTEAMLTLSNNMHLRKTYGQKATLHVTQKFSNEAFKKAMDEILNEHVN